MPSASPIPVIMFTMKIESPNSSERTERHDDRHDRHEEWDEPRDDGAEDEHEDDQRGRQAELKLAGLQVVLGQLVEVVVERVRAGDGDRERRRTTRSVDDVKDAVDVSVVRDVDLNERRVPVA